MDYRVALITGIDIPVINCGITMHQPTISEIAFIGETDFFTALQTLCLYKEMFIGVEGINALETNFDIFINLINDKTTREKKDKVVMLFQLIFPQYHVLITPNSLIFTAPEQENIIVDKSNFEQLQEIARLVFCLKDGPADATSFNPGNEQAKKIAEKLMRGRQRVAAQKQGDGSSVFAQYLSILSVGLHIAINQLTSLTVYQLYDMMERYGLYINWDLDIKQRLAGGKPDKPPDNWMKNIH